MSGKSSSTSKGMAGSRHGFARAASTNLTWESQATRAAKSAEAESSIGTGTAPRSRQAQKAATHSAELEDQSRTRSFTRIPLDLRPFAKSTAFAASWL